MSSKIIYVLSYYREKDQMAFRSLPISLVYCVYQVRALQDTCNVQLPTPSDRYKRFCPKVDTCADSGPFSAITARGCFCDRFCFLYGDCCQGHHPATDVKPLSSGTYSCRDVKGIWSQNLPVYIVDKCQPDQPEGNLKKECETSSEDVLNNWPVSDTIDVLYKNIFCLQCNDKKMKEAVFWDGNLMCDIYDKTNDDSTAVIQRYMNKDKHNCNFTFVHPKGDNLVRNCKVTDAKCPLTWNNQCVKERCEGLKATTQYRYEVNGETRYKNPYCALCQGSTAITCHDLKTKKRFRSSTYAQEYGTDHPLMVSIDLNKNNITIKRKVGSLYNTVMEIKERCAEGQVYDVSIGKCRIVDLTMDVFVVENQNACPQYINLDSSQYVRQPDGSVYVNGTKKTYSKKAFLFCGKTLLLCIGVQESTTGPPSGVSTLLHSHYFGFTVLFFFSLF